MHFLTTKQNLNIVFGDTLNKASPNEELLFFLAKFQFQVFKHSLKIKIVKC